MHKRKIKKKIFVQVKKSPPPPDQFSNGSPLSSFCFAFINDKLTRCKQVTREFWVPRMARTSYPPNTIDTFK